MLMCLCKAIFAAAVLPLFRGKASVPRKAKSWAKVPSFDRHPFTPYTGLLPHVYLLELFVVKKEL